jgi:enoyl-CoA hydratase/carnithine racemase
MIFTGDTIDGKTALASGLAKAAVQWRDSGKPIPEADEARELVCRMDEEAKRKSGAWCVVTSTKS